MSSDPLRPPLPFFFLLSWKILGTGEKGRRFIRIQLSEPYFLVVMLQLNRHGVKNFMKSFSNHSAPVISTNICSDVLFKEYFEGFFSRYSSKRFFQEISISLACKIKMPRPQLCTTSAATAGLGAKSMGNSFLMMSELKDNKTI